VYHETEGNPFFIEEVCKALVESGKLYYEDGRWQRPSIEELGIPQSLRVAIQSRVGVLPTEAQEALRLAAVLGRVFELEVLVDASELDEGALYEALEDAERAQLIEEVSGERYAFVHALFASTLVKDLRTLQRRRLHRRAAAAIAAQHPEDYEALAYHYSYAGQAKQAAEYSLKAGDRARGLYAYAEARQHYAQALDALSSLPDTDETRRQRVDTLIAQVACSWRADSPERNLARLTEAEQLARPLLDGSRPLRARRVSRVCQILSAGGARVRRRRVSSHLIQCDRSGYGTTRAAWQSRSVAWAGNPYV
jgi:predicted ATPase